MTMCQGAVIVVLRKHKLNIGSSTKLELVSIANVLGIIMWSKYFMESQGYTIKNNVLYQDNKSTILLAKSGRMSAGKASKHTKNIFFLITNKIPREELTVHTTQRYGIKLANDNMNPLQGNGLWLFRSVLMGIPPDYNEDVEWINMHPFVPPEAEAE